MLEYKGYHADIIYSADSFSLYGKLAGISDLITFESESAVDIVKEFHDAVDDYLETCKEIGKEPDREYNGKLQVQVQSAIHKSLSAAAENAGESLNSFVGKILSDYVAKTA